MKPLIIANWKMNPVSLKDAEFLLKEIKKNKNLFKKIDFVIAPPFIYLPLIKGFRLAAQNCFWEKAGAFTGEISPLMLKNIFCDYVIIGHSERKMYLKEDDKMINRKMKSVLDFSLIPILCIGEKEKQKDKNKIERIILKQIKSYLKGVPPKDIVIAYEPIWAIGTGNNCDIDTAENVKKIILKILLKIFGINYSKKIKIIYGGSVNSKNAADYIKKANFDGLLIGGASLKKEELVGIIKSLN